MSEALYGMYLLHHRKSDLQVFLRRGLGELGLDIFFSRIRMNILNHKGTWNSVKGSGANSVELRSVAIKVVSF